MDDLHRKISELFTSQGCNSSKLHLFHIPSCPHLAAKISFVHDFTTGLTLTIFECNEDEFPEPLGLAFVINANPLIDNPKAQNNLLNTVVRTVVRHLKDKASSESLFSSESIEG